MYRVMQCRASDAVRPPPRSQDKQKGVAKDDPMYEKIDVRATAQDGQAYSAITFIIRDERRQRRRGDGGDGGEPGDSYESFAPSALYRSCVVKGAREAGLPAEYTAELEAIADNGNRYRRKSVGAVCDDF